MVAAIAVVAVQLSLLPCWAGVVGLLSWVLLVACFELLLEVPTSDLPRFLNKSAS